LHIVGKHSHEWSIKGLLQLVRVRGGSESDKSAQCLEVIVVKPWVTGIGTDDLGDVDQMLQDSISERDDAISDHNQNPHDAFHQKLVFLDFLRGLIFLDQLEYVLKEILRQRCDRARCDYWLPLSIREI